MEKKNKQKPKIVPTPQLKVEYVQLSQLQVTSFQPPSRSTPGAIASLLAGIAKHGILSPLHAIRNGMIADGHRRLACGIQLRIPVVPVIYHDGTESDLPDLWTALNKDTRKIDGKNWLHVWFTMDPSCDLTTKLLSPLVMKKIRDCWEVFGGKEGIRKLVQGDYSPFAGQRAKEALRFINSFESLSGILTPQMIGDWVMRQGKPSLGGMDFTYRAGLASGRGGLGFARKIVYAVKNNKPLTEDDLRLRLASKNITRSRKNMTAAK